MNNMTTGSPIRRIIHFAIPLLIGNIFQLIYNMVDTFIVGRTMGVDALAGIGSSGSVMFLILGFAQGITAGLAIPLAQAFGAKDFAKVKRTVFISWIIALLVALCLTLISVYFLDDILITMQTPQEIYPYSYAYLHVIFSFSIITMMYNLLSNMMRALGDSRTPLYFLAIAAIVNIILDYTLIVHFHLGVAGAGIATVTAQGLSVLLCFIAIYRKWPLLQVEPHLSSIRRDEVLYSSKIAFPMAFQSSIIAIGAIAVTVALNGLGPIAVASYAAATKVDQVVILILMSFGITMATYVGQNFGAQEYERIRQGVRQVTYFSVAIAIVSGIILFFFGRHLVGMFANNQEMLVYGQTYFYITGPAYWILALLFIYRYTLQGLGNSLVPTIAGIMELFARMGAAILLSQWIGFAGPSIASPLAWIGATIPLAYTYHTTKHHFDRL